MALFPEEGKFADQSQMPAEDKVKAGWLARNARFEAELT
jgi:hypothetical protein